MTMTAQRSARLTEVEVVALLDRATSVLDALREAVVARDPDAQLDRATARMAVLAEVQAASEAGWPADREGVLKQTAARLHRAEAALEQALQTTFAEVETELLRHRRSKNAASAYGRQPAARSAGGQNLPDRQRKAA